MDNEHDQPTGKAIGGTVRMSLLSPAERKAQAKAAAKARWSGKILKATHGSADHPLKIGDMELPAYVLEDGRRVLSLGGMVSALGMSIGSAGGKQGDRLYQFATGKGISPFVSSDLLSRMKSPVSFRAPTGGTAASGYEATILPDLCDAVLAARDAGALRSDQMHIAKQCEILVRGLARVGIIALVDEATGYQKDRAKDALAKILEAFIAKELQPWVKTFPAEFYEQMFRLREMEFPSGSVQRPRYFGLLTNDIVYKRLAPGVLAELKRVTPRNEEGRPTAKYFQSLTANTGYSKLKEHIGAVIALMKISDTWDDFMRLLDKHYTRYGDTIPLPLDDGKGL
jgi:hypothetical protein